LPFEREGPSVPASKANRHGMTTRGRSKSSETEASPLSGFACRNGQPSLVFGQRADGSIAHISEVPRGKECGCVCPACGIPLVARQGQVRDHHFGHLGAQDGRPCSTGPETALHMFAKELLARELRLTLPPVQLEDGGETWSKSPGGNYTFDRAILEHRLGNIIPDVIVTREGRDLIVEFAVTNECGPEKIARIQELDLAAVEIRLSDLRADVSKEEVEKGILDTCRRKWLHNPLFREGAAALDARRAERDRRLAELAARAASGADRRKDLPRLRTEKIRKLATDIIGQLPEHETRTFDLDAWFWRALPGRSYSMAEAVEFDLGPYTSVMSELASLLWNIRLEPLLDPDLMGLPLQAELERAVEGRRQEEELREVERRERPFRAARDRADRILQEAWAAGVDGDRWAHAKLGALGGRSPSEVAYDSDEGLDAALALLAPLARQHDIEMRREQAVAQAREGFRKVAAKVYQGQHLELFMRASHPALGRKSPNDYCVDEVSMNRCIEATLPAAKRRRW